MQHRAVVVRLLVTNGVIGFGDGLWFTLWAIFFTRIQGIAPAGMGLAVGLGGLIGLLAATPVGVLAERWGPRDVFAAVVLLRGVIMFAYLSVANFWTLVLVTALFAAGQSSAAGVRVTLTYGLMSPRHQLRVLAQSRVVQHITYAVGAGAAAYVLAVGTRPVFVAAVVLSGVTFVVTAALSLLLPSVPAVPAERRRAGTQAIRDLPYLAIMTSTAALALCWSILSSGLPLWIAGYTVAPLWTAGLAVVISSVAIALFQVRVTGREISVRRSVRATHSSAVAMALCCVIFAAAAWIGSPVLALVIILLGVGAHVISELFYVSARWGLSLGLMSPDAQGQYQGVAASTEAITVAVGPAVVTALITGLQGVGWLLLGGLLLAAAAPTAALCRRALRTGVRTVVPGPAAR